MAMLESKYAATTVSPAEAFSLGGVVVGDVVVAIWNVALKTSGATWASSMVSPTTSLSLVKVAMGVDVAGRSSSCTWTATSAPTVAVDTSVEVAEVPLLKAIVPIGLPWLAEAPRRPSKAAKRTSAATATAAIDFDMVDPQSIGMRRRHYGAVGPSIAYGRSRQAPPIRRSEMRINTTSWRVRSLRGVIH